MPPQAHQFVAGADHQPGQPPHQPGVVNQAVHRRVHTGLQRVGFAAGAGGGDVVAIEHRKVSARPQHPPRLRQGKLRFRHVAQRGVKHDGVARLVIERKCPRVALHKGQVRQVPAQLPGLGDEDRRRIHSDNLGNAGARRQRARHRPRPAAHLHDPSARGKPDIGQIGVPHFPLAVVSRPELQDVDQRPDERWIGLADVHIDVGHDHSP